MTTSKVVKTSVANMNLSKEYPQPGDHAKHITALLYCGLPAKVHVIGEKHFRIKNVLKSLIYVSCVRARARARARVRVRVCVRARARMRVRVTVCVYLCVYLLCICCICVCICCVYLCVCLCLCVCVCTLSKWCCVNFMDTQQKRISLINT